MEELRRKTPQKKPYIRMNPLILLPQSGVTPMGRWFWQDK